jgi:hypothetical protein
MNAVMKLLAPSNAEEFSSGCTTGGLSRRAQFHGVSFCQYS